MAYRVKITKIVSEYQGLLRLEYVDYNDGAAGYFQSQREN